MLDFYADWCTACREMEAITFKDPSVHLALKEFVLLKVDVTETSDDDQALLHKYGLIGPPATLFFGNDGQELKGRRVVGFMEPQLFLQQIRAAIKPST
jgi:thiol:disulfide interchange protein DsbD